MADGGGADDDVDFSGGAHDGLDGGGVGHGCGVHGDFDFGEFGLEVVFHGGEGGEGAADDDYAGDAGLGEGFADTASDAAGCACID